MGWRGEGPFHVCKSEDTGYMDILVRLGMIKPRVEREYKSRWGGDVGGGGEGVGGVFYL